MTVFRRIGLRQANDARAWPGQMPLVALLAAVAFAGCSDMGTQPNSGDRSNNDPPEEMSFPVRLTELVPGRTVEGDTLTIEGSGFGEEQGTIEIRFRSSGTETVAAGVVAWSESAVRVVVPPGAASGVVVAAADTNTSNGLSFSLAPRRISYADDVDPVFSSPQYGCKSCHGGSGGLNLGTREELLGGDSDHGPVVIPRRSARSVLIQKLNGTAGFGSRMPIGGRMAEEDILVLSDWIDQGAPDN